LSPRRERSFVQNCPAAEKALSASTDVAGTVRRYLYACWRRLPRTFLVSNMAISVLIAAVNAFLVAASDDVAEYESYDHLQPAGCVIYSDRNFIAHHFIT